jgi:simple sugar transport system substrate-binding protein
MKSLKYAVLGACLAATGFSARAADPVKIAFVYSAPIGDGGWNFAHEKSRRAIQAKFGDKIQTSYVESVRDGADSERVMRELISGGAKMIVGTSFGYMGPMLKLASEFPDVKFEHVSGYKTASNMRIYNSRIYEGFYLAGVVAGTMTKTNVIGFVGAVPIPEVMRNVNSYTLGAQSVNPKITTKLVWTGEWFNPPKESDAANALINAGADILMQNTASASVPKTAEQRGKRGFGVYSDMRSFAPKAMLGSAIVNWTPYYTKATQELLDGTWKTDASLWGVKQASIDLVSLPPEVPESAHQKLESVKDGLRKGTFSIWKGPIVDQGGKTVLPANVEADDKFLDGINFLVRGIDGTIPVK